MKVDIRVVVEGILLRHMGRHRIMGRRRFSRAPQADGPRRLMVHSRLTRRRRPMERQQLARIQMLRGIRMLRTSITTIGLGMTRGGTMHTIIWIIRGSMGTLRVGLVLRMCGG